MHKLSKAWAEHMMQSAEVVMAAIVFIYDLKKRIPAGEPLRCPYVKRLDNAINALVRGEQQSPPLPQVVAPAALFVPAVKKTFEIDGVRSGPFATDEQRAGMTSYITRKGKLVWRSLRCEWNLNPSRALPGMLSQSQRDRRSKAELRESFQPPAPFQPDMRTTTGRLCGDPQPGRSALDKKES